MSYFCACFQYFEHVGEAEWAVQVLKTFGKNVAAALCVGPEEDLKETLVRTGITLIDVDIDTLQVYLIYIALLDFAPECFTGALYFVHT